MIKLLIFLILVLKMQNEESLPEKFMLFPKKSQELRASYLNPKTL